MTAIYTRSISRITLSQTPLPAWRQAMNGYPKETILNLSGEAYTNANSRIVFPHGGVVPTHFTQSFNLSTGGAIGDVADDVYGGFASCTLVEDVGAWGTLVYGTGGHTRISAMLLSQKISDDSPTFNWWQQPTFEISDINGADFYYNLAEFNTTLGLGPNQKFGQYGIGMLDEAGFASAWLPAGKPYPVGFDGWIWKRAPTLNDLGNNAPHGYRYKSLVYIPPAMTGTGSGALVHWFMDPTTQGPFGQSNPPQGVTYAQWFDAAYVWPVSGRRKTPISIKNTQTGAWTHLGIAPDAASTGAGTGSGAHLFVAREQKRVYCSIRASGVDCFWYIDFSGGIAGATVSSLITPTGSGGRSDAGCGVLAETLSGRRLIYWLDETFADGLFVQDLDNATNFRLRPISGFNIPVITGGANTSAQLMFDRANNRILILPNTIGQDRTLAQVTSYITLQLPSLAADLTNAAAYTVATRSLTLDGSVTGGSKRMHNSSPNGIVYHAGLGVVILNVADSGRSAAFRPI